VRELIASFVNNVAQVEVDRTRAQEQLRRDLPGMQSTRDTWISCEVNCRAVDGSPFACGPDGRPAPRPRPRLPTGHDGYRARVSCRHHRFDSYGRAAVCGD
jgi:hypothetical protein